MRKLVYSPRARQDLEGFWTHTADTWGFEQADRYTRDINTTCEQLAAAILPGHSADDVRAGYRRQFIGAHVVFYTETLESTTVARVLHQRMDVPRHLR